MLFRFCNFIIAFGLTCSFATAQVTLIQKYPEGTKYVTQSEQKSKQTLVLQGMNIDTKSSTFTVGVTNVGKRADDGILPVEERVQTLQSEISMPGGLVITYDSANPDKGAPIPQLEPIVDALRAMNRLPVTLELDAQNKIKRVKLPDGEFEKLSAGAKDRFSPEWLQKASEQARAYLPDGPVKVGDSWERSHEVNAGDGQIMTFRTRYDYTGTTSLDGATLDKITGKVLDVNYTVNDNAALQIKNCQLKVVESNGTYLFDREKGATISRQSKVQLAGELTIVFNSMELAGKVDLTLEELTTRQK